ncbi:MAG: phosphate/phosphite/phosphonate ABC transporter substrate-binding protein [Deltaproteobacteria bacterium]|nr:phosphate/phosphite/phosphonate ABC transporter substrate-binding protein [Deltaproteobacteria bacterium]
MNSTSLQRSNRRLLARLAILTVLFFAMGCSGDGDSKVVDFSDTVQVARPGERPSDNRYLRVAVGAMISPKETTVYYRQILDYISSHIGKESELIQRKTYDEINELFGKGEIDLAFICSGPYANSKDKYGFELLATPQVKGSHFYHSYLIVNKDSPFHRLEDLRGRVFAFTDPESNTGKLVPTYWLAQAGEKPETFFGKTIYTYSHDNSIMAVAKGLVDGAAIDGLIWEYYDYKNSSLTSQTRIIRKSEPYGIPPIVAHRDSDPKLKDRIRQFLFSMHQDPEGQRILAELMIDRFIAPREQWYETIRKMKQNLALLHSEPHEVTKP